MERFKRLSRRNFFGLAGLAVGTAACSRIKILNTETSSLLPTKPTPDSLTISPTATTTLTPEPPPMPDTRGYFEKYVYPALLTVAEKRRKEKSEKDPDFWHRVDKELNSSRINFVLLGFGSESSSGAKITDSNQIMPLDLKNNELRIVAIERDTWAPEIERETKYTTGHYRINHAFQLGGMLVEEKVIEDATGLSADFVLGMEMGVLSRAVKELFDNKLEVCIPERINDVAMGVYEKGLRVLNGDDVLNIARARQFTGGSNPERDFMQQLILRTIMKRVKTELSKSALNAAGFITKALIFYGKETQKGSIVTNFDSNLFLNLGAELAKQVISNGIGKEKNGIGMPDFTARYEVETESAKDPNDVTRHKPKGGNPNTQNLVSDYWFSSREGIKTFLESPVDKTGFEEGDTCTAK